MERKNRGDTMKIHLTRKQYDMMLSDYPDIIQFLTFHDHSWDIVGVKYTGIVDRQMEVMEAYARVLNKIINS